MLLCGTHVKIQPYAGVVADVDMYICTSSHALAASFKMLPMSQLKRTEYETHSIFT